MQSLGRKGFILIKASSNLIKNIIFAQKRLVKCPFSFGGNIHYKSDHIE
jgi:hypothetical protein